MTSEYMNNLYRDLLSNSPQTVTIPIPSDMGTGQIAQVVTKQGAVVSDWKMNYFSDMNVRGINSEDYIQMLFCLNDGVSWNIAGSREGACLAKGESCIYRGHGKMESLCYAQNSDFYFKNIKIPVPYFKRLLQDYFEDGEITVYEKKLLTGISKVSITPYMEHIFAELQDFTHYRGGLGYLFLESKIHELLSVYLSEVLELRILSPEYCCISKSERDCIIEAKRIIDSELAFAPSCEGLARQVQISVSKLSRGFSMMLSDIEAGHVNCVIVKDLSRLGRNTIDTGYYIEQYFRIRSIRFIAVNENFDTANPEDAHSGIIIPLRNMINEAYALDIGRKIRAQQRQAMKDGKFIGARTPYGYLKAEDDCHQLIIDPVAAVVVQRMFRWASEGAGLNTIAVRLNEAGVLTPSHYKKMQGKITHENLLGSGKWQTRTVGVILRSEVYTGDLVQGQTKTVDHRQVKADAEEWTVVQNTHEAIISREQFATVQAILDQTASRAKAREVKAFTPNLLKGKVFCAHCGGSLHRQRNIRKKSDDVYFYHCLSQSRISKDACPGVTIREDALLDMLADMLQDALDTALGQYTISLAELPRQAADRAELREKITSRKQEIQRLRGIVRSLYENLVQGVLTKDEYFDYKEKYESRIADLAVEMEQLEDGLRTMDAQAEQHRALEQDAAQIKTDRALTGALIERLIDRIEVSHDKQITVRYRFQGEFETYAEVLEQCRNM